MIRAFALLVLLAGCTEAPPPCGLVQRTELPVEMVNGTPLVTLGIGDQTATMVLDTGAQSLLLMPAAVRRLGLKSDQRLAVTVGGLGGSARNFAVILPGVTLGRLALPAQYSLVAPADLPPIGGRVIDGLLGLDILGQYEIDLDLPHRRLALYGGAACPGETPPDGAGLVPLPGATARNSRIAVEVEAGGAHLHALLDTGAVRSVIRADAAARAGATDAALQQDQTTSLTGVGPARTAARRHLFADVAVGPERFSAVEMQVVAPADSAIGEDMILGADYMSARRLWLSYARRLVLVQPLGGG